VPLSQVSHRSVTYLDLQEAGFPRIWLVYQFQLINTSFTIPKPATFTTWSISYNGEWQWAYHHHTNQPIKGRRLGRRASRRPFVCIDIPAFYRIAGLSNRHVIQKLGIALTLTGYSLGCRRRLGHTKDYSSRST
jgi:hypothetical protein